MKSLIIVLFVLFGVSGASASKTQSFSDVPPSSIYYDAVERCFAAGVMVGYPDGSFKPDDPLTRWQAAVVIERAAFGVFEPPSLNGTLFDDVEEDEYYQPFVEDFGQRGITSGCGTRLFCPYDATTREQLAVFIVRSLGEFNPPTPSTQRFNDVLPSNPFYNFIDRLAALNITLGCSANPPLYCPTSPVTRGQMALFCVRAYGL